MIDQGVLVFSCSFSALLITTAGVWSAAAWAEQPAPAEVPESISETVINRDFCLTIQCDKSLAAGEEHLVTIIAHNKSDRMMAIQPLSRRHMAPRFELWRDGKFSRTTKLGEDTVVINSLRNPQPLTIRRSIPPKIKLQPKEALKTVVDLTLFYETSTPGEYELVAACTLFVDADWKNRFHLRTDPPRTSN